MQTTDQWLASINPVLREYPWHGKGNRLTCYHIVFGHVERVSFYDIFLIINHVRVQVKLTSIPPCIPESIIHLLLVHAIFTQQDGSQWQLIEKVSTMSLSIRIDLNQFTIGSSMSKDVKMMNTFMHVSVQIGQAVLLWYCSIKATLIREMSRILAKNSHLKTLRYHISIEKYLKPKPR